MKYLLMLLTINSIGIMLALSGCTSTTTKEQAKEIIKPFYDAGKEIYIEDKEKLKDENSKRNDDLGGTGAGNIKTEETKQETQVEDKNVEGSKSLSDVSELSTLNWTSTGDTHHIVQCYFGHGHDSELFKMIAQLPVDFICTLDKSGVTISCPTSDDTGRMASYGSDHMQARRAFVCLFNADNNLVDCQDFAESFHLDSRWKNKGAVKGLTVHCKRGNAVSRTALTDIK